MPALASDRGKTRAVRRSLRSQTAAGSAGITAAATKEAAGGRSRYERDWSGSAFADVEDDEDDEDEVAGAPDADRRAQRRRAAEKGRKRDAVGNDEDVLIVKERGAKGGAKVMHKDFDDDEEEL